MRAPVYRNIEAKNAVLGLVFPTEVLIVMSVFWATMLTMPPTPAAVLTLAVYAGVRLCNYCRAPAFLQHWVFWKVRQMLTGGRLSAAARARVPRFPFAPYIFRDVPRRGAK